MDLSPEDKWRIVEDYYSRAYRMEFKTKPDEDKIDFLYNEMQKLGRSLAIQYERGRPELERYLETKRRLEEVQSSV